MIDWYYLENLPDKAPNKYENLKLLAQGYTINEIALLRGVASGTVKNQVRALRNTVGAKNTNHLVALAYQAEIL